MRGSAAFRAAVAPGGALAGPWVRDPLWRRARAVPSLDLPFAERKSLVDAVTGQSLVTFTRASSATYVDSEGVLQTAAVNVPRFTHNPVTGESLGLLVEDQRANLLLNSATLSSQSVTVTAVAHTLSFYGTGTVTLSGVSTAGPAVGSGAYPTRTTLTFTPTAGTLTLTVSGSVTSAQLEAGSFPTSYIPTTASTVTRSADVASITGANFSSWYRQDEGTVFADAINPAAGSSICCASDNTSSNRVLIDTLSNGASRRLLVTTGAAAQASLTLASAVGVRQATSAAYKVDDYILVNAGTLSSADTSGSVPTVNRFYIGSNATGTLPLNGTIRRLTYFPQRLPNTTLQAMTR